MILMFYTDKEAAGIGGRCWGGWAANSSACAPVNGYAVLRTMSNACRTNFCFSFGND
jgi:hypothetical protein